MFDDNLRDPAPPVPGAAERAKVDGRAKQIKRNRRFAAAGGALGVVAVLSLGVVGLSGGSSGSGTSRIEVAGAVADRTIPTVPAPTTVAPAPTVDTTPAPAPVDTTPPDTQATTQEAPAPTPAPTYTVSGTIPGYPQGVTGSVRLMGAGGTFTAPVDANGNFSISGVPAGTYDASYSWQTTPDGAAQVARTTVTVNGDGSVSFG
jgi:hypothetical protein